MMRTAVVFFLSATICCAQEIKRPTANVDSSSTGSGCFGTQQTSPSMALSIDSAGLTTAAALSVSGSGTCPPRQTCTLKQFFQKRLFNSWQTTANTYSSLVLNVNSFSDGSTGTGNACIKYSTDNGMTWTTIRCDNSGNGWTQTTDTITLSPTQPLSKLLVTACAQGNADSGAGPGFDDVIIWDIWTVGGTGSQAPGNGSNSGNAHRGIIMIRAPRFIWRRKPLKA